MQVPFVDLSKQVERIKPQFLEELGKFLDRGQFILSPEVKNFEEQWAQFVGAKFCVGVSSGADALFLALTAFGIGPGDEVITQGNAFNASVTAILRCGGVPRFVDINPDFLTMDVKKIEAIINENTKAILPVHLYGQSNDMEAIMDLADKHDLVVIEDCAQAHGAEYAGKKVGSFGDAGCFSFYPTKNLGAFGDAGGITLNSQEKYDEFLARRHLGQVEKNQHVFLGTNMRLDPLHAIVLSLKLKFLSEENEKRRVAARRYDELIRQANLPLQLIKTLANAKHVYHLYNVKVLEGNRDELINRLKEKGVESGVYYPQLVYEQPFYRGSIDSCPIAESFARSILALPMFPDIAEEQQKFVVQALSETMK